MKNTIIITFSLLLTLSAYIKAQNAEITYIGNEGFMITNNSKKIFIDALYSYGNESVALEVDALLRKMIINNAKPFSNGQLFLVTHDHGDHYSKEMVTNYLKNNLQSKLVASSGIIDGIGTSSPDSQLVPFNLKKYESVDTIINGIQLTAYNVIHDATFRTYNLGYFANIDGFKIFHGGDNSLEDTTEYIKYKLNEKNIDVLFLWNYSRISWKTQKQRDFIKKYINPKYIILMHIPPSQVPQIKKQVNEIIDSTFPPILVFNTSMEKLKVDDTISFINNMPEKLSSLTDTTFRINTPVNIVIPKIFNDIDANDSLSYYASGLPKGIKFDSAAMNLSGSAEKVGTYTIKITAKDKSLCANSSSFKLVIADRTSISSDENQKTSFIYTNSTYDKLIVNNIKASKALVEIYDLNGKLVLNKYINDNILDISNLSKGMYIVKLFDSENILSKKLIIY